MATSPLKQLPGIYYGSETAVTPFASITIAKPDASVGILSCTANIQAASLDTNADANITRQISAVVAADGQSVTIYGWKQSGASLPDLIAPTIAWTVSYTLICDMKGA